MYARNERNNIMLTKFPALMNKILERHTGELATIHPMNYIDRENQGQFRAGLNRLEGIGTGLWYKQELPNGSYTSRLALIKDWPRKE